MKDVAGVAELLGETEKAVRAQVARGLLPHRRYGGRVIFITAEIETFLRALPGISPDQALANITARAGRDGAEAR